MDRRASLLAPFLLVSTQLACSSGNPATEPADGAPILEGGTPALDGGTPALDGPAKPDAALTADGAPTSDVAGDAASTRDAAAGDRPVSSFPPPMYPPPMTGSCASGCPQLRSRYADAVLKAQSCTVAGSPCGFRAPGSLGCGGCDVWVDDVTELAPIYNMFNQMGCYGCYFGGPPGENRCHATGCNTLDGPMCRVGASGAGTCVNQERDRTCAPGVMTGAPCPPPADYCTGGGHSVCSCRPSDRRWSCA